MSVENASRVMNGTWGALWENGSEIAEVTAFQVKVTKTKSAINQCGLMAEDSKVTSIKYSGSMTLNKVYTRGADDLESIVQGLDVRKTLVGELADPDAVGAERIACYGVSYDEQTLADWAAAKAGTLTIPFTCTRVKHLDKAEA